MVGRGKAASSIESTSTNLLRNIWNEWDVRGLVLFSLFLQIALFVLGKRRKYSVGPISRMILWFAYISADWVAIAALGKLSSAHALSPTKNVLRALWAPILILHLGGPDTITAYALQDTQLWTRHILTLVVQSMFAIYVIYFSWTYLLLSILTIPLILAGIIKYVERILCLKLINSKKTEPVISMVHGLSLHSDEFLNNLLRKNPASKIVVLGYLWFSVMRPDANEYLSSKNLLSSLVRIKTYMKKTVGHKFKYQSSILSEMVGRGELSENPLDIAAIEMGFIYDIVYTKISLIFTKKGCFLRLISFTCSFLVLLLFLIRVINEPKFHFSRVDIHITISLLVGAVAQEFFAVYSMFSSHWTIPLMLFHKNWLVRKILQYVYQHFPCLLFPQWKEWSGRIGQFNLLEYYWNSRNVKGYGFLEMGFSSWHKFKCTRFVEVPKCLKMKDYEERIDSFFNIDEFYFEPTRGEKTLDKIKENASLYTSLKESIELDFDTSIIVWHLATSICYYQDFHGTYRNVLIEDRKSSKYISDYMMYLLASQPAMLLPEHCRSFWLDACDELKDLFFEASNMDHALTLLLKQDNPDHKSSGQGVLEPVYIYLKTNSSSVRSQDKIRIPDPLNELKRNASNLVLALNSAQIWRRWEIIKEMWIEMLLYAAHSCQHANHIKQLAQYDREFLTLIWVMGGSRLIERMSTMGGLFSDNGH